VAREEELAPKVHPIRMVRGQRISHTQVPKGSKDVPQQEILEGK
jgi:hypothetical protein